MQHLFPFPRANWIVQKSFSIKLIPSQFALFIDGTIAMIKWNKQVYSF